VNSAIYEANYCVVFFQFR